MKQFNPIMISIVMLFLATSVTQCSSAQKLEHKAPLVFGEVYYQKRAQAVKDLGSVITLYIPVNGEINNIKLDSVYFKGMKAKLKVSPQNKKIYYAHFITKEAYTEDFIFSSDVKDEHQNKLPIKKTKIPFDLLPNQCVISYIQEGELKFYKISNIKEKLLKQVPMEPRNKP